MMKFYCVEWHRICPRRNKVSNEESVIVTSAASESIEWSNTQQLIIARKLPTSEPRMHKSLMWKITRLRKMEREVHAQNKCLVILRQLNFDEWRTKGWKPTNRKNEENG